MMWLGQQQHKQAHYSHCWFKSGDPWYGGNVYLFTFHSLKNSLLEEVYFSSDFWEDLLCDLLIIFWPQIYGMSFWAGLNHKDKVQQPIHKNGHATMWRQTYMSSRVYSVVMLKKHSLRCSMARNWCHIVMRVLQISPGGAVVKKPPANAGDLRDGQFDLWVRKNCWRRKWQPTPVFLLGKFHGQSLEPL